MDSVFEAERTQGHDVEHAEMSRDNGKELEKNAWSGNRTCSTMVLHRNEMNEGGRTAGAASGVWFYSWFRQKGMKGVEMWGGVGIIFAVLRRKQQKTWKKIK